MIIFEPIYAIKWLETRFGKQFAKSVLHVYTLLQTTDLGVRLCTTKKIRQTVQSFSCYTSDLYGKDQSLARKEPVFSCHDNKQMLNE